ncbi:hypothetical protein HGRIS_011445 [Hohenbuehelia grisea]|uniref:Uncharacterized protein n=1 Tax=Hohenbuehelia grisea TaxID=104357 RepID=A0ABR3JX36_9AGAR
MHGYSQLRRPGAKPNCGTGRAQHVSTLQNDDDLHSDHSSSSQSTHHSPVFGSPGNSEDATSPTTTPPGNREDTNSPTIIPPPHADEHPSIVSPSATRKAKQPKPVAANSSQRLTIVSPQGREGGGSVVVNNAAPRPIVALPFSYPPVAGGSSVNASSIVGTSPIEELFGDYDDASSLVASGAVEATVPSGVGNVSNDGNNSGVPSGPWVHWELFNGGISGRQLEVLEAVLKCLYGSEHTEALATPLPSTSATQPAKRKASAIEPSPAPSAPHENDAPSNSKAKAAKRTKISQDGNPPKPKPKPKPKKAPVNTTKNSEGSSSTKDAANRGKGKQKAGAGPDVDEATRSRHVSSITNDHLAQELKKRIMPTWSINLSQDVAQIALKTSKTGKRKRADSAAVPPTASSSARSNPYPQNPYPQIKQTASLPVVLRSGYPNDDTVHQYKKPKLDDDGFEFLEETYSFSQPAVSGTALAFHHRPANMGHLGGAAAMPTTTVLKAPTGVDVHPYGAPSWSAIPPAVHPTPATIAPALLSLPTQSNLPQQGYFGLTARGSHGSPISSAAIGAASMLSQLQNSYGPSIEAQSASNGVPTNTQHHAPQHAPSQQPVSTRHYRSHVAEQTVAGISQASRSRTHMQPPVGHAMYTAQPPTHGVSASVAGPSSQPLNFPQQQTPAPYYPRAQPPIPTAHPRQPPEVRFGQPTGPSSSLPLVWYGSKAPGPFDQYADRQTFDNRGPPYTTPSGHAEGPQRPVWYNTEPVRSAEATGSSSSLNQMQPPPSEYGPQGLTTVPTQHPRNNSRTSSYPIMHVDVTPNPTPIAPAALGKAPAITGLNPS